MPYPGKLKYITVLTFSLDMPNYSFVRDRLWQTGGDFPVSLALNDPFPLAFLDHTCSRRLRSVDRIGDLRRSDPGRTLQFELVHSVCVFVYTGSHSVGRVFAFAN